MLIGPGLSIRKVPNLLDSFAKLNYSEYSMPRKTLALIIGLIVLTVILLAVALRPLFLRPPGEPGTEEQASVTPTPPAYTSIILSPNPLAVQGTSGSVEVVVDTEENSLTAVQLEMSYDPSYLTNVSVVPGDFFPDPISLLDSVDTQNGRITYALGITPAQTPVQGQGVVATVNFNVIPGAAGETQIELLPKTIVTQEGVQASVLKNTTGTTLVLNPQVAPPAQTAETGVPESAIPPIDNSPADQ